MFSDDLIKAVSIKKNPSVLGLDTLLEFVPSCVREESFKKFENRLKGAADAVWTFNQKILDQVFPLIAVVKLQMACYEMLGIPGMEVFLKTIQYAREKGLLVIADGKRNDIGSSAQYYANTYLGKTNLDNDEEANAFPVDALTVNPYLGEDGIKPFLEVCKENKKGIFVLVKTSNPSSGQFQDLSLKNGELLYQKVGQMVKTWGEGLIGESGYSAVGAVVGATYPSEAKILRESLQGVFFLVPGYGAQGATAKDVAPFFDENKQGALINASRSILLSYQKAPYKHQFTEAEFDLAAKEEVQFMQQEIQKALD